MKAIILAAGYATRLYPLTLNTPKALLPLGDRTVLDRLMDQVVTLPGLDEIHVVTNHKFYDAFRAWAERARPRYPDASLSVWDDGTTDEANRLGAVGDMQFTIEQAGLDDDLLVAASDNVFTFPLIEFYEDFRRTGRDTLLMQRLDDIDTLRAFAVATLDADNRVLSLVEKPKDPPSDIGVYALYLYRRDTLPLIKRYLDEGHSKDQPGRLPEWMHTFRDIRGYLFDGECVDIGTTETYYQTAKRFEKGGDLFRE